MLTPEDGHSTPRGRGETIAAVVAIETTLNSEYSKLGNTPSSTGQSLAVVVGVVECCTHPEKGK